MLCPKNQVRYPQIWCFKTTCPQWTPGFTVKRLQVQELGEAAPCVTNGHQGSCSPGSHFGLSCLDPTIHPYGLRCLELLGLHIYTSVTSAIVLPDIHSHSWGFAIYAAVFWWYACMSIPQFQPQNSPTLLISSHFRVGGLAELPVEERLRSMASPSRSISERIEMLKPLCRNICMPWSSQRNMSLLWIFDHIRPIQCSMRS